MANAVTAFLDDHLATGGGARPAITTPTERATYRLLPDGLEWATTSFGALRIGAVGVPLLPAYLPRTPTGKRPRFALRARAERLA